MHKILVRNQIKSMAISRSTVEGTHQGPDLGPEPHYDEVQVPHANEASHVQCYRVNQIHEPGKGPYLALAWECRDLLHEGGVL
ncbi:hypothetical protein Taro_040588 [Colocasia esculenta]|uniref:Uncharacterized protein n=1 Tax=Colocasia esculenta TaxID=4460 RepID=A0A843WJ55_COLES|nr:hypothetical protein [Colocasia esculenta]